MQHTKQHQECGVCCNLWVKRLASSKSFKYKSTIINYLQWKTYAGWFCQAVKWKDETANSCSSSGKVVLAQLHLPPQEFKQLFTDPLFFVTVRSYNSIFAVMSMDASLTENAQTDKRLANTPEGVCMLRVQGTICHHIRAFLPTKSKTPSSAKW